MKLPANHTKKRYRLPRKLKKKVPPGIYCYTFTGKTVMKWNEEAKQYLPAHRIKICPLYFHNHLGYGDCRFLHRITGKYNGAEDSEWDCCLDDQCKSCSIRKYYYVEQRGIRK